MVKRNPFPEGLFTSEGVVCRTEEETRRLGENFAAALQAGDILSLEGPLGAGKTQFVKGLARGLGVDEQVTSPTFTLVHEYGGARLVHFDFYRLEQAEDLQELGLEDYGGESILAVEWGDKFPQIFPSGVIRLKFELLDRETRRILGSFIP